MIEEEVTRRPIHERVDFTLRPAKNIERQMLCEALARLSAFGHTRSSYQYVGFGSIYFSDFILFHKCLGVDDMVSIEWDEEHSERFEFNRPFGCIDIKFGPASDVLPELNYNKKTILWLDYDMKLNSGHLGDIRLFAASAPAGSFLVVTVLASPDPHNCDRLAVLAKRVGKDKVPIRVKSLDLAAKGLAKVSREIIDNEIRRTLQERNGSRQPDERMIYEQVVYFQYQDGQPMMTVGGVLFEERQRSVVGERCAFSNLSFYAPGDEPHVIDVPRLTFREIRYLNRHLPHSKCRDDAGSLIPQRDREKYEQVYRYFPAFTEAEV